MSVQVKNCTGLAISTQHGNIAWTIDIHCSNFYCYTRFISLYENNSIIFYSIFLIPFLLAHTHTRWVRFSLDLIILGRLY